MAKLRKSTLAATGIALFAVLTLVVCSAQTQRRTSGVLRQVATIDLPGPGGKRFDYLAVDEKNHRLFSNHLAAGLLYVIDLRSNKLLATVKDVPGAEGIAVIPEMDKAYTADWYENRIAVIDLKTMQVVKKIATENKPDGIAYAAPFHKIYVSDERGKAEAVVDVRSDTVVKTLRFDSETGMPQYDPAARKVYVNLQDDNLFAVIDPATDEVVARYPVGKCRGNHGMAIDPAHHRAFLSCEDNELMTVFDLDKHEPIAYLPMASGPDVVQFDAGMGRIYVACGSGAISVFQQDDGNHYRKLGDVPVQRKVHSIAVDPETHRVYAPEEQEDGRPVARTVVFEAVR